LYAQLLMAASLAVAAIEDVRDRSVSDLVWAPAAVGIGYTLYWMATTASGYLELQLVKMGLVGAIGVAFVYFGLMGEADAIAIVVVGSDPYPLSPILPLLAAAVVGISHIAYAYTKGFARGKITIPMERFLKEQAWIPKAIIADGKRTEVSPDVNLAREEVERKQIPGALVEVSYGLPDVAYFGIGYAAYVAFLIVSAPAVFAGLP
jgi:hypothetical protein